jgi:hypothetical protein
LKTLLWSQRYIWSDYCWITHRRSWYVLFICHLFSNHVINSRSLLGINNILENISVGASASASANKNYWIVMRFSDYVFCVNLRWGVSDIVGEINGQGNNCLFVVCFFLTNNKIKIFRWTQRYKWRDWSPCEWFSYFLFNDHLYNLRL